MKVKEYYNKQLEDDFEFELGYLEWIRENEADEAHEQTHEFITKGRFTLNDTTKSNSNNEN